MPLPCDQLSLPPQPLPCPLSWAALILSWLTQGTVEGERAEAERETEADPAH